eukprot:TRINITY_DN10262_c0_g1_i1.p1 TRINITY_DN10262_c0_g1~~TRINITY_DN10262_c0_g1_i1.p1  ORF type:complete len:340 (+),score=39.68 TRINITY_DN10262_c0_g1_i1:148-1167(+)
MKINLLNSWNMLVVLLKVIRANIRLLLLPKFIALVKDIMSDLETIPLNPIDDPEEFYFENFLITDLSLFVDQFDSKKWKLEKIVENYLRKDLLEDNVWIKRRKIKQNGELKIEVVMKEISGPDEGHYVLNVKSSKIYPYYFTGEDSYATIKIVRLILIDDDSHKIYIDCAELENGLYYTIGTFIVKNQNNMNILGEYQHIFHFAQSKITNYLSRFDPDMWSRLLEKKIVWDLPEIWKDYYETDKPTLPFLSGDEWIDFIYWSRLENIIPFPYNELEEKYFKMSIPSMYRGSYLNYIKDQEDMSVDQYIEVLEERWKDVGLGENMQEWLRRFKLRRDLFR